MKKLLSIEENKKRSVIVVLLGLLALVWLVPFISTGVSNNDELMNHLFSVYKPLLYDRAVEQGRVLRYYLGYPLSFIMHVSKNFYIAKLRDFSFIMLSMCSLGFLYYKFFGKFAFSCLTICISLALLPVTFEHTLPQAYCSFAFYFSLFIGTVLLFMKWKETDKKFFLVVSLIVNFYVLFIYEVYITLMPLYVVAAWHILPEDRRNLRNIFHLIKYHIMMSVLYLTVYLGIRVLFPSTYEGNSVGSLSVSSIGQVIKQLSLASLPGYYWINEKYRYIFRKYSDYELVVRGGVKGVILNYIDANMILFGIVLLIVLALLLGSANMHKLQGSKIRVHIYTILTAACFVVLPLLPMSVSVRYQTQVNATNFISLSAVYFSYLTVSFIISYIIWEMSAEYGRKAALPVIIIIMVFSMGIQVMNHVIEDRQREDFYRVRAIEKAISTDVMSNLENMEVNAPDLYEVVDALSFENTAVSDGYWTLFSRYRGHNMTILNSDIDGLNASIFYMDEKGGGLVGIRENNWYYLLSDRKQSQPQAVKIDDGKYAVAFFDQYSLDTDMYLYQYLIVGDTLMSVSDASGVVGNTWAEALKMANIYNDGFIGYEGDFAIQIGESGKLTLRLYCPFELSEGEEYWIYVDGQEMVSSKAQNGLMVHTILTDLKNEMAMVHIETNFTRKPDNGDERDLSMIISDVYTE